MSAAIGGVVPAEPLTHGRETMHSEAHHLSGSLQTGIGIFYLLVVLMNLGFAYYYFQVKNQIQAVLWAVVAVFFGIHAGAYLLHMGWSIPVWLQDGVNWIMGPTTYFLLAWTGFALLLVFRRFFTLPP